MATVVPIATSTSRLEACAEALNGFVIGLVSGEMVNSTIEAALADDAAAAKSLQALLDDALQTGRLDKNYHQSFSAVLAASPREDLPTVSPASEQERTSSPATARPQQFSAISATLALGPGSVLRNRFVLQAALEPSGMSQVFKALDRRRQESGASDPHVAVKVAGPGLSHAAEAVRLLQQEATTAQRLDHPHIVRVLDFDRDGEFAFIVMEWLEGESLAAMLDRQRARPPDAAQVNQILHEIGAALTFAHSRGVTHADVKPGNIFIGRFGTVKLLDFGTARGPALAPDGAEPTEARTPAYASCEVLEGERPQPQDDVYSLACVIYRLLAGRRAFGHHDALAAERSGRPPAPIRSLPPAQWQALERALAFRRAKRTRDIASFLEEFGQVVPTAPPTVTVAPVEAGLPPTATRRSLWPAVPGALVGALVVAGVAAVLWPETPMEAPPTAASLASPPTVARSIERPAVTPVPQTPQAATESVDAAPAPDVARAQAQEKKETAKPPAASNKATAPKPTKRTTPTKERRSAAEQRLASFANTPTSPLASGETAATSTEAPATPAPGATATTEGANAAPKQVVLNDLKFKRYVEPTVRSRNRDVVGWVELMFTVDAAGATTDIRIIDSSPSGVHDEAALAAVRKWRFQPARENGAAVARRTGVRLRFEAGKDQ